MDQRCFLSFDKCTKMLMMDKMREGYTGILCTILQFFYKCKIMPNKKVY